VATCACTALAFLGLWGNTGEPNRFFGGSDLSYSLLARSSTHTRHGNNATTQDGTNDQGLRFVPEKQQAGDFGRRQPEERQETPIKIAHAVSLITCSQEKRVAGFLDALVILRHSIHQNSIHSSDPDKTSRYSYQMYAFVHAKNCPDPDLPGLVERIGYIPKVVDTPVSLDELPEGWYRRHVEGENCCGSSEFIKLYAYTLIDHPIFVHWDLDVAVLQPMDDLFDAMLYDGSGSVRGRDARSRLQVQRPAFQKLPGRIDAFLTRDVTSAAPWEEIQAVQGGFLVARPSIESFEAYVRLIREADYRPGRGPGSGWGVSSFCSLVMAGPRKLLYICTFILLTHDTTNVWC